jgi:hypothetical protein
MFHSSNSEYGWDGKFEGTVSQDGVYAWRIVYTCGNELKERAGLVTILK